MSIIVDFLGLPFSSGISGLAGGNPTGAVFGSREDKQHLDGFVCRLQTPAEGENDLPETALKISKGKKARGCVPDLTEGT